jgi:hypothetical protein
MKTTYRTLIVAFAGLMSALLLGFQANAECGVYQPRVAPSTWQPRIAPAQLLKAGFAMGGREDEETTSTEPTIVGLWKEHWISKGSEGIPDGTEVDTSYSQWHSDGTEMQVSGLRPPMTGDVCLGVWEKAGPRAYKLNHFGVSYDSSGLNLVGVAVIRQSMTVSEKGDEISGSFTIDQYDESGNKLTHVQGTISGTRVTMNTGFQKVE